MLLSKTNIMVVIKRVEIVALFLWMGVFCCFGQTDSVAICAMNSNEIQEKYVVESMDSITTERVEEQILLQQFVESLEEFNASCPMKMESFGNAILDSLSFEYPQVNYHLSIPSKDYQEKSMEQIKEEGALQILLSRTTHFFWLIRKCNLGLTYHISFLDKEGGNTVIYTPDEISQIYSQEVSKERVLQYLSNVLEEANKLLPTYAGSNLRVDYVVIDNRYMQYHYTIFENENINIKNLKKSKETMKLSMLDNLMAENSELYMMTTGFAILDYGFIFRYASATKRKHLDIVFSPDEIQEIERNRLQR